MSRAIAWGHRPSLAVKERAINGLVYLDAIKINAHPAYFYLPLQAVLQLFFD